MHRSLTIAKLRVLARLYRENIEGAADELHELIAQRWDELPEVLRNSPESVARIRDNEAPLDALAKAIEQRADCRNHRAEAARVAARVAASTLIDDSHAGPRLAIPITPLRRILALWPGSGQLSFGERGGVDVGRLREFLRACPTNPVLVVLHPRTLVVRYLTPSGFGRVRFALRSVQFGQSVLRVPLSNERPPPLTNIYDEFVDSVSLPSTWPADNEQDRSRFKPPSGPELPYTQHGDQA